MCPPWAMSGMVVPGQVEAGQLVGAELVGFGGECL